VIWSFAKETLSDLAVMKKQSNLRRARRQLAASSAEAVSSLSACARGTNTSAKENWRGYSSVFRLRQPQEISLVVHA
jgi:hypothetical protein